MLLSVSSCASMKNSISIIWLVGGSYGGADILQKSRWYDGVQT